MADQLPRPWRVTADSGRALAAHAGPRLDRGLRFDAGGRLRDMGMAGAALATLLGNGDAFRTSGCPDCNRPYYNERPGQAPVQLSCAAHAG